jgi:IS30 family transposase
VGESLKAIGRAFSKPSSSIYFQLALHGGIRPAARRRSRLALTLSEREEISRGIAAAQSARSVARLLGRSPSTVSRELNRNGGYGRYRAALADEMAWARARGPKRCKLANNPWLRQAVASKLRLNWSPEQIAGSLKRWRRGDGCNHVSHETIYRSLFVQTRGVLKSRLVTFDRSGRSADLCAQTRMATDGGKSRIWCQSVSGRRRLKIVRSLVIRKAISCPGQRTATSRPRSNVIRVM